MATTASTENRPDSHLTLVDGVELSIERTPGGSDYTACIVLRDVAQDKLRQAFRHWGKRGAYQLSPTQMEQSAAKVTELHLPAAHTALNIAKTSGAHLISIVGLPVDYDAALSPLDGTVDEPSIRQHLFHILGLLTHSMDLGGMAYTTENAGNLLRAITPVAIRGSQASSQGFRSELGFHQDNADRWIAETEPRPSPPRGPMNSHQAFATVREEAGVPMEVVSLSDVLARMQELYGPDSVSPLFDPEFLVSKPESHGRGALSHKQAVLTRDAWGQTHGRFHFENVAASTTTGKLSLARFKSVLNDEALVTSIGGRSGDLLMYSNTRALHRRRQFHPRLDGTDRYYIRLYLGSVGILDEGRVFE